MSIREQIDRIKSNTASSYRIIEREGLTPPEKKNTHNLPSLINSLINSAPPDYIIDEAQRVATAVEKMRSADSLVFPVMSDFHLWDQNSESTHLATVRSMRYASMGIAELKKRMNIDFIGYLGDYSWMNTSYTAEQVIDDITAVRETNEAQDKEIWCVGNHDLNYGKNRDRLLTSEELYNYIGSNSDGVNTQRCYGYLDFEAQKIRVIYLNTCDASDLVIPEIGTANASSEWISPTQIQWLADTALNFSDKATPREWGIVIVGHHPLHYSIGCFKSVMTVLEAYKDGLSGTISCTIRTETDASGNKTYPQQKVTYDFSAGERAEIICNIHGHAHNYASSKISSTSSSGSEAVKPWLWRFCIPQICASRNNTGYENFKTNEIAAKNYGEFEADGVTPKYWTKETGNAKATSFCVVDINRSKKKVFAYYFGIGKDREFSYEEEYIPAEYSISVSVSNCTAASGNPTAITEGETAALSFTANDGYELPDSVTVTGASYAWDKETGTLTLSVPTADVSISVTATKKTVTNLLRSAFTSPTDSTIYGEDYDGDGKNDGYKKDTRYSTSSGIQTREGYQLTGIIPTTSESDIIRIKGIDSFEFYIRADGDGSHSCQYAANNYVDGYAQPDSNGVYTLKTLYTKNTNPVGIRFSGKGIDENTVITVNEPIE